MQLLFCALLLLSFAGGREFSDEVKPYISEFGGERGGEIIEVLERAERLSQAFSAVTRFTRSDCRGEGEGNCKEFAEVRDAGSALAPVKDIADEEIYASLAAYMAS